MPRYPSTQQARNKNINVNKYFISSSEDRTHNQSILKSHLMPLRHDWPQFNLFTNINIQIYVVTEPN